MVLPGPRHQGVPVETGLGQLRRHRLPGVDQAGQPLQQVPGGLGRGLEVRLVAPRQVKGGERFQTGGGAQVPGLLPPLEQGCLLFLVGQEGAGQLQLLPGRIQGHVLPAQQAQARFAGLVEPVGVLAHRALGLGHAALLGGRPAEQGKANAGAQIVGGVGAVRTGERGVGS